jgi:hypothetical protein
MPQQIDFSQYEQPANTAPQIDFSRYQPSASPQPEPSLASKALDFGSDLLQGVGEGALQTVSTVAKGLNKIPVIGEKLAPSQGISSLNQIAAPDNLAQHIGSGAEGLLEFMAGDEMLKGLSLAAKLNLAQKIAKLAESHAFGAKLVNAGLGALRQGTVGAAQAAMHGADAGEAAKTGVLTAGTSAALESAGNVIGALKPSIKRVAGENIPVRASQESNLARTAENVADNRSLQKFDVEQTQLAAKRAIGNVASDVSNTARSRMLPDSPQAAIEKLQSLVAGKNVGNFADAAKAVKAEAQPVFRALDDLSAGEEVRFSDWQKAERSSLRRGDYEAAAKARTAQQALLDKYSEYFDSGDLQKARAAWKQANALEDIHAKLNSRSVLEPTPESLRRINVPDPGVINGRNFSKQILALRNNGALQAAGLSPEHAQILQDIGTLLERSAPAQSRFGDLVQLAGKFSKKVSGSQFVVNKLLTSPKAAATIEAGLKSNLSTAVLSKMLSAALGTADENQPQQDRSTNILAGRSLQ